MSDAIAAVRDRVSGWFGRGGAIESAGPVRPPRSLGGPDRLLCGVILALTAFGVVMVFSASFGFAAKRHADWTYFLKREVMYAVAGLFAFTFALRTDYATYRRFSYPLLFLTIAMLAGVLVLGTRVNGAVRWFRIGPMSFQPAELAKFSLALYLAVLLARKAEQVRTFSMGFLPPLVMTGVIVGLIVIQPDLGTSIILGVMALGMLFVAGTRTSYIVVAVLLAAPVGWKVFITGTAWRMQRMLAFLNPWAFCQERAGYQLCESLISVGSGGVFGQGLGGSRQKLFYLPEAHNDFILAVIGEELGLVGVLALLAAFVLLVWRGMLAAMRARDVFGSYLAFGLTTLFGLQALANMSVVLGLVPTKGLALPFISYGGTSLVVSLFMAGVLGNISARNPEPRPSALLGGLRRRMRAAKNKKSERGARVVVVGVGPTVRKKPDFKVVIPAVPTEAVAAESAAVSQPVSEPVPEPVSSEVSQTISEPVSAPTSDAVSEELLEEVSDELLEDDSEPASSPPRMALVESVTDRDQSAPG